MHVVVIPSWYPQSETDVNGIFFRSQAQALQRQGFKIGVVAPMFRSLRHAAHTLFKGPYGIRKHQHGGLNTYVYDSMYFFPRCPMVDLDCIRWVKAGLKAFDLYVKENGKPDIVHAHAINYAGILAHAIFKKYNIPFVLTEHSSTIGRNLIRPNQWPAMHAAMRDCSKRFAVSRDFCTLLQQKYNGLDWEYLPNILGKNFAQHFDVSNKSQQDFTFCSVSHLRHLKGHDLLLPAFAKALQKYPHLKLKIGGNGPEYGHLTQMAADLNIQHAVSFLGGLGTNQVLDLMSNSHAFVLASRIETFGVVFIEALSQGLPVIATKCGGPQSIVNEHNGFLIPTENIDALSDALIQMYEQHQRFSPHKLREDCLNEFGEDAITSRLIQTFDTITQK